METTEKTTNNPEVLVYVRPLYKEEDGTYVYAFLFSDTPDDVWGADWDIYSPASNPDLTPDSTTYSSSYIVRSKYRLKTLQETTCYPMEYAIYGIMALAWIDIEGLDEYPEHGRMVFHFRDSMEKVKSLLEPYGFTIEKSTD